MDLFYRTLKWPVISLLITGATHFLLEAIWPDLRNTFIPPVLAPILLAYGAWVGYRAIGAGGTYPQAIAAAATLGILPVMLDIVGFGLILGRGTDAGHHVRCVRIRRHRLRVLDRLRLRVGRGGQRGTRPIGSSRLTPDVPLALEP